VAFCNYLCHLFQYAILLTLNCDFSHISTIHLLQIALLKQIAFFYKFFHNSFATNRAIETNTDFSHKFPQFKYYDFCY